MTTKTDVKKPSWISKVMGLIGMSEEGQVGLFYDMANKSYEKSIKELNKRIAKIKEDHADFVERETEILEELRADLDTAAITVDPKCLTTREERESYFKVYTGAVKEAKRRVSLQETKLTDAEKRVAEDIKSLENQISELKALKAFLD